MFSNACDLSCILSTNGMMKCLQHPIWLFSVELNQVVWANTEALQLFNLFNQNNFTNDGQAEIIFTRDDIRELNIKKSIIKKWNFLDEKFSPLWGICSAITLGHNNRLILVEGIQTYGHKLAKSLREKKQLEELISQLLLDFISLPVTDIDKGINHALKIVGEYEEIDRSYVFTFDDESETTVSNNYEWCREGIEPEIDNLQKIPTSSITWFMNKLKHDRVIYIADVGKMTSAVERELLEAQNIKSLLSVAIIHHGELIGFVGFDSVVIHKSWNKNSILLLKILAKTLGNAINRKERESILRQQQKETKLVINSLPGIVFKSSIEPYYPMKYLSQGCLNITEFEVEELMNNNGYSYNSIILKEDFYLVNQTIDKARDKKQSYEVEYRIRTKSGLIKWVWEKGHMVLDREGNVREVEGFINDITQLKKTEEALRESEARYRLLAENTTDLISRHLPNGTCIYASSGGQSLLGYKSEEFLCSFLSRFCHPEDLTTINNLYHQIELRQEIIEPLIYRMLHHDGYYIWVETCVKLIINPRTKIIEEFIAVSRNITKRMQIEEALKQAEEQYRGIFEHITQGVFQSTQSGYYLKVNPALAQIYGYDSAEELIEKLRNIPEQLYVNNNDRNKLIELLDKEGLVRNFECEVYRKDGSIIWISENTRKVCDPLGNFLYYEGTVEDITYRRQTEAKLIYDALHDNLTQIYNRAWFTNQLQLKIQENYLENKTKYAVLFIDLDQFKVVNDSFGHLLGDELLKKVCIRLKDAIREQDKIARFGGDEFVILIDNIKDEEDIFKVVRRIQKCFQLPFQLKEKSIFSSASIGIALSNKNYEKSEDLLRDADIAMYQAKAQGKNSYMVFNTQMYSKVLSKLQLENDLRHAIKNKQLLMYYQPIINLDTGHLIGFEALLRWYNLERGWVSPQEFIPIAEETGFIHSLGLWVLQQACQQLTIWNKLYPDSKDLVVNVNLSPYQFKQSQLVKEITKIIKRTGLQYKQLKLEITESGFLETINTQSSVIQELESLGVQFCIDDFGTGYSSFSRLHEFPIHTLKIDRAFTSRLESDHTAIVQTILTLAHTLGMDVVAEGIETPLQLEKLKALGCRAGQGFLFSPPVSASMAEQFFRRTSFLPTEN